MMQLNVSEADHQEEDPRHEVLLYIIVGFGVIGIALLLITPGRAARESSSYVVRMSGPFRVSSGPTPDGVSGDPI